MPALSFDEFAPPNNAQNSAPLTFDEFVPKNTASSNEEQAQQDAKSGKPFLQGISEAMGVPALRAGLTRLPLGIMQAESEGAGNIANMIGAPETAASLQNTADLMKQEAASETANTENNKQVAPVAATIANLAPQVGQLAGFGSSAIGIMTAGGVAGALAPKLSQEDLQNAGVQPANTAFDQAIAALGYLPSQAVKAGADAIGVDPNSRGAQGVQGALTAGESYGITKALPAAVKGVANALPDFSKPATGADFTNQAGLDAINSINQSYGKAQNAVNASKATVRQAPIPIYAPDLLNNLNSTIEDLSDKVAPGSKEQAALSQLKKVRDNIVARSQPTTSNILDADGNAIEKSPSNPITTNDLMDINESIRAGLPVNRFLKSGETTKLGLKGQVDNLLDQAGEQNPNFGAKYDQYRQDATNIARTFSGNKALKNFWQPEDYTSWKAAQNGNSASPYNDTTLNRANTFLDKLNTDKTGNILAAIKAMDPQTADAVLKAASQRASDLNPSAIKGVVKGVIKGTVGLSPFEGAKDIISTLAEKPEPNPISDFYKQYKKNPDASGRTEIPIRTMPKAAPKPEQEIYGPVKPEIQGPSQLQGPPKPTLIANKGAMAQAIASLAPALAQKQAQEQTQQVTAQEQSPTAPNSQSFADLVGAPNVDFAKAESNNNPNAKNSSSTASGLDQFTNRTWAEMVKKYGKQTGYDLKDKNNPQAQAEMTRLYALDNIDALKPVLGRMPTKGELYMAHVLGAGGAAKLINAPANKEAIMLYPRQVFDANRSIFFNGKQPRSAGEVYKLLNSKVT